MTTETPEPRTGGWTEWLRRVVAEAHHGADGTNPHHDFAECGDPFCSEARARLEEVLAAPAEMARLERERLAKQVGGLRADINNATAGLSPAQREFFTRRIDAALAVAQVPVQEERSSGYLPGMTHGTGGNLIPAETQELERLRMVEVAARRFLEAAALESMTKAPGYIKAKRALRRALGDGPKDEGAAG